MIVTQRRPKHFQALPLHSVLPGLATNHSARDILQCMQEFETFKKLRVHYFPNKSEWMTWLHTNWRQRDGIWIKFAKKNSGVPSLTYEEGREAAIIYGWIDGQINGLDEVFYLRKFTPRRPRSKWSKINRKIAVELISAKRMMPSGLKQVADAKEDGRWDAAYDSPSTISIPADLKKLIATDKTAEKNFNELSSANRYAFLYRIQNAKRPETRQRHIDKTFEMLRHGKVYHPERAKIRKKK